MNFIVGGIIWLVLACIFAGIASPLENPYNIDNVPEKYDKRHTVWITLIAFPLIIINIVASLFIHICSCCVLKVLTWKEK